MSLTLAIGSSRRLAPASNATCNDSAKFSTGTMFLPRIVLAVSGRPDAAGAPKQEIEIIEPEKAIEQAARILYRELEHCDPKDDRKWVDLTQFEREVYRTTIEGLLLSWNLLERARAEISTLGSA
jgi:hypothetical protein